MKQNDFLLKCLYDLYSLAIEEKVIFKILVNEDTSRQGYK